MTSKTTKQTPKPAPATRSFWAENPQLTAPAGVPYIKAETLASSGEVFLVEGISDDLLNTYQGRPAPRWLLDIDLIERQPDYTFGPNGEEIDNRRRRLGLAMNDKRGEVIEAMRAFIAETGKPVPAMLKWVVWGSGGFYTLEAPPEDELTDALRKNAEMLEAYEATDSAGDVPF